MSILRERGEKVLELRIWLEREGAPKWYMSVVRVNSRSEL